MCLCVCTHACVGVHAHVWTCVLKSDVCTECLPQFRSTLFLKMESLNDSGASISLLARLAGREL